MVGLYIFIIYRFFINYKCIFLQYRKDVVLVVEILKKILSEIFSIKEDSKSSIVITLFVLLVIAIYQTIIKDGDISENIYNLQQTIILVITGYNVASIIPKILEKKNNDTNN